MLKIVETLHERIAARFPGRGLVKVAEELAVLISESFGDETLTGVQWLPLMESTVNDLVFAAVAIFFLYTIPERLLGSRALRLLDLAEDPGRRRAARGPALPLCLVSPP